MISQFEPSIGEAFSLAIHNRRQAIHARRLSDGVSIREITPTLAWVSCQNFGVWASGRRAIGRAVRLCRTHRGGNQISTVLNDFRLWPQD